MQELEKILEEIEAASRKMVTTDMPHKYYKAVGTRKIEEIIRKHMNDSKCGNCSRRKWYQIGFKDGLKSNDGWIPVEERLPENEAREYIDAKYGGIGYLYPCLVTYKNPVTRRVYTASFYYDIHQKWFVNIGENLLPRNNVFAWMEKPEPYRPEQPETCKYTGGSCCWPIDQCIDCPNHPERSEK